MSVDLGLAIRVQRLAVRQGLPVAAIALRLAATEGAVMDALTALAIPLPGEKLEPPRRPSDDERAVMFDRMPKKMQDRRRGREAYVRGATLSAPRYSSVRRCRSSARTNGGKP